MKKSGEICIDFSSEIACPFKDHGQSGLNLNDSTHKFHPIITIGNKI